MKKLLIKKIYVITFMIAFYDKIRKEIVFLEKEILLSH